MNMGTNNPWNAIINVFGMVYLHISAAGQGRECYRFLGSPVDNYYCCWLMYPGDTKNLIPQLYYGGFYILFVISKQDTRSIFSLNRINFYFFTSFCQVT